VNHVLSWINLSGLNPEEFIPEQFKVYFSNIPAKPSLIMKQDKSKYVEFDLSDKNYTMELLQNQKSSFTISFIKMI